MVFTRKDGDFHGQAVSFREAIFCGNPPYDTSWSQQPQERRCRDILELSGLGFGDLQLQAMSLWDDDKTMTGEHMAGEKKRVPIRQKSVNQHKLQLNLKDLETWWNYQVIVHWFLL